MVTPRRGRMEAVGREQTVTTLELFFDLVFVFALTQVTDWIATSTPSPTVENVVRGVLIVCVMWWCWVGYAWVGNVVKADEGVTRIGMFLAMAGMFVAAITIPEAFVDQPGGLYGPVVFAACYFFVRAVHLGMFWLASREDPMLRGQVLRFVPSMLIGTVLLLVASQFTGTTQTLLWVAALVGDYAGTMVAGTNWRLYSPGHFAERHGLIIIVALGESIVSIGIGVAHLPVSWSIIVASSLGLAVVAALWWAYFDVTALITERALAAAEGARQIRLARGGYSFLHLPMVIGVIMTALGLKKALNYISGVDHHTLADPLYGLPLLTLYGGAALYLASHVGFKAYVAGSVTRCRVVVVAVLLALIPVVWHMPALETLTVLALVLCSLIAYETRRFAEQRHAIRHENHGH